MYKIKEITDNLNLELAGCKENSFKTFSSFYDSVSSDITFANSKDYLADINKIAANVVVINKSDFESIDTDRDLSLVLSINPKLDFVRIYNYVNSMIDSDKTIISELSTIGKNFCYNGNVKIDGNVTIGNNVSINKNSVIFPNVYIGNDVILKENVIIYPNVTILDGTIIGNHSVINSGSVIGSDGFGYVHDGKNHLKVPHFGSVEIGDNVEIGACNTIDKGTFGKTLIKDGVKTDNHVHIAHNVCIGKGAMVLALTGIAGSAVIGDHTIIGGQVGIKDHVKIGNHVMIAPKAGISENINDGEIISGAPGIPHKKWLKVQSIIKKLPEIRKKLNLLDKKVNSLKGK